MKVQVTIYGILRVIVCNSSKIEMANLYYANKNIRDEVLMRFIAEYPEDGFYPFELEEVVDVYK